MKSKLGIRDVNELYNIVVNLNSFFLDAYGASSGLDGLFLVFITISAILHSKV